MQIYLPAITGRMKQSGEADSVGGRRASHLKGASLYVGTGRV